MVLQLGNNVLPFRDIGDSRVAGEPLPARIVSQPDEHRILTRDPLLSAIKDKVFGGDTHDQDNCNNNGVHFFPPWLFFTQPASDYSDSVAQATPRRIGQPESLLPGLVGNFFPGQEDSKTLVT